jgi:hypothetical protein
LKDKNFFEVVEFNGITQIYYSYNRIAAAEQHLENNPKANILSVITHIEKPNEKTTN